MGLNWEPAGHPLEGVYTIPHFDFHFYLISQEEVINITGEGCSCCCWTGWVHHLVPRFRRVQPSKPGSQATMGAGKHTFLLYLGLQQCLAFWDAEAPAHLCVVQAAHAPAWPPTSSQLPTSPSPRPASLAASAAQLTADCLLNCVCGKIAAAASQEAVWVQDPTVMCVISGVQVS